jgi:UTP--glucose-1-phosphate uridylyltransferase
MASVGLPEVVIRTFLNYYSKLGHGAGLMSDSEIAPPSPSDVPDCESLTGFADDGTDALRHTAIVKLNGGLGTTMGLSSPKSLIEVKDGLTFLDIIVRGVGALNRTHGLRVPFVLMDSYNTHEETESHITGYLPVIEAGLPHWFMQHRFPRINKDTLGPVTWPADPDMEWNPPGHGDIYTALQTSGLLDALLAKGIRYAFVSNSDNLGATMDLDLLGYFARKGFSLMMEAARRSASDTKGGHLAVRNDGRLVLREIAQCPVEDMSRFQDISLYQYFNTNNIWLNLVELRSILDAHNGVIDLPLIRNEKNVDPTQPATPRVIQLETAMGSALSVFPHAAAVCVPRTRFLPVKKCDDLVTLRSDCYTLDESGAMRLSRDATFGPPAVDLDLRYFGQVAGLRKRFPHGSPSLIGCTGLTVRGDVVFGKGVVVRGAVAITNASSQPLVIADGRVLDNETVTG